MKDCESTELGPRSNMIKKSSKVWTFRVTASSTTIHDAERANLRACRCVRKLNYIPRPGAATWCLYSLFLEWVARVPVSLWASGGWRCARWTLRLRLQPFATVRGRSREPSMAVPMVSSAKRAKVVTFVEVSNAAWPCFAWQAWHFVTVQHAS